MLFSPYLWVHCMMKLGAITLEICFQPKGKTLSVPTHTAHGEGGTAARHVGFDEAKCDQHMETFIKCIKASGETVGLLQWCRFTLQLLKLSPAVTGSIFPNKQFLPRCPLWDIMWFIWKFCLVCRWELGGRFLCHQNDRSSGTSVSGRWERRLTGPGPAFSRLSAGEQRKCGSRFSFLFPS